MPSRPSSDEEHGMPPTAPITDERLPAYFPAVLVHPDEDPADLQRRLEACLLIVRHIAPALAAPAA